MNIDEDDTKLFRLLEPGEFGIYTQSDELPVSDCPVYLMEGVGGSACRYGYGTGFQPSLPDRARMVLALFPWQLISTGGERRFRDRFPHIARYVYRYPQFPVEGQAGFFFYMRTHIASEPREEYVGRFRISATCWLTVPKMLPSSVAVSR